MVVLSYHPWILGYTASKKNCSVPWRLQCPLAGAHEYPARFSGRSTTFHWGSMGMLLLWLMWDPNYISWHHRYWRNYLSFWWLLLILQHQFLNILHHNNCLWLCHIPPLNNCLCNWILQHSKHTYLQWQPGQRVRANTLPLAHDCLFDVSKQIDLDLCLALRWKDDDFPVGQMRSKLFTADGGLRWQKARHRVYGSCRQKDDHFNASISPRPRHGCDGRRHAGAYWNLAKKWRILRMLNLIESVLPFQKVAVKLSLGFCATPALQVVQCQQRHQLLAEENERLKEATATGRCCKQVGGES